MAQALKDPNKDLLTSQMAGKASVAQEQGEDPVFNPDEEHGIVVGDGDAAYVQNGHQFGRDQQYLRTEPNRGVGKAFDPRKVGLVRRPKPVAID